MRRELKEDDEPGLNEKREGGQKERARTPPLLKDVEVVHIKRRVEAGLSGQVTRHGGVVESKEGRHGFDHDW